jgi:hypothetical protein
MVLRDVNYPFLCEVLTTLDSQVSWSRAEAGELRKRYGGTSLQARTALTRLIHAGKVTFEGKATATRYEVA